MTVKRKTREIKVKTIKSLINHIKKELIKNEGSSLGYRTCNSRYFQFYIYKGENEMDKWNSIVEIDLISKEYYNMTDILNEIFKKHIQFSK